MVLLNAPQPVQTTTRIAIASTVLLICAVFLFTHLGHYALWDDEANTAMYAHGVWETGDMSAIYGKNLVAFQNGAELVDLKARWFPPLQYYLAAPLIGIFGVSSYAARMPFGILGLATTLLLLYWANRLQISLTAWVVLSFAIVGNVSMFLYFRQCRYYGLTISLSAAVAYLYVFWTNTNSKAILFSLALTALIASNYLAAAALCMCIGVDILTFNRWPDCSWRTVLLVFLPVTAAGVVLLAIYSPLGKGGTVLHAGSWWTNHLTWAWWNVRDSDTCEFGVGPLILLSPLLASDSAMRRWAWRGLSALVVYLAFVSATAPHGGGNFAELRYLCPIIPLCIALGVLAVCGISRGNTWIAVLICIPVFLTNLATLGGFNRVGTRPVGWRSTLLAYMHEMTTPPGDPYSYTAAWINQHIEAGKSAWVCPDYAAFPLMVHAPKMTYGWQLIPPPQGQFKNIDRIQFAGVEAPDYIILFGPNGLMEVQNPPFPIREQLNFRPIATIATYFADAYKPELFLHAFAPVTQFNERFEAIYIFERSHPAEQLLHL